MVSSIMIWVCLCFFMFLLSTCCVVFCHLSVAACFVADWLQQVVVSTVNFFMGFYVGSLDHKVRFDKVIKLNHIHQYAADF